MTEHDKASKLSVHPLAAALADDPSSPRDTVQIVGYIGKAQRAQHVRVYLSLAFDEYLDVPGAAILHHADVPEAELPHGGTRLWVDASAQVVHETRQSTRTEARFLEGAIATEHLQEGAAEPAAGARAFGTAFTQQTRCPVKSCALICQQVTVASVCPRASCLVICRQTLVATCNLVICGVVTIGCSLACPSVRVCPSFARCPSLAGCPSLGWCGGDPRIPRTEPIDFTFEVDRNGGPDVVRQMQQSAFGAGYAPGGYAGGPDPYGAAAYGYGPPYGWPYSPWSR